MHKFKSYTFNDFCWIFIYFWSLLTSRTAYKNNKNKRKHCISSPFFCFLFPIRAAWRTRRPIPLMRVPFISANDFLIHINGRYEATQKPRDARTSSERKRFRGKAKSAINFIFFILFSLFSWIFLFCGVEVGKLPISNVLLSVLFPFCSPFLVMVIFSFYLYYYYYQYCSYYISTNSKTTTTK